ncbi:MAG: rhomboid family intramembrane serine protease [Thermoplasmata archaeon]|nr:rhomboid family intramembrane serine protease [Thermoplasmata archaeon]
MEISLIPMAVIFSIVFMGILAYFTRMGATVYLLLANTIAFIISIFNREITFNFLGFRPSYLSIGGIPHLYTLITSTFVHYDILHLLGNMLTLFFLGMAFERRVGSRKFILLYFITGICGDVIFSLLNRSDCILIGASGAIFGILGSYAASYPRDEVLLPLPLGIVIITRIRVFAAAVIFTIIQFASLYLSAYDNVAYIAHLGGLASGLILGIFFVRRERIKVNIDDKKIEGVDYLEKLSRDEKIKEIVRHIREEEIPEVRESWLEKLAERARCPYCGGKLEKVGNRLKCRECGKVLR